MHIDFVRAFARLNVDLTISTTRMTRLAARLESLTTYRAEALCDVLFRYHEFEFLRRYHLL
jgi:hypothetical protein